MVVCICTVRQCQERPARQQDRSSETPHWLLHYTKSAIGLNTPPRQILISHKRISSGQLQKQKCLAQHHRDSTSPHTPGWARRACPRARPPPPPRPTTRPLSAHHQPLLHPAPPLPPPRPGGHQLPRNPPFAAQPPAWGRRGREGPGPGHR